MGLEFLLIRGVRMNSSINFAGEGAELGVTIDESNHLCGPQVHAVYTLVEEHFVKSGEFEQQ